MLVVDRTDIITLSSKWSGNLGALETALPDTPLTLHLADTSEEGAASYGSFGAESFKSNVGASNEK